MVTSLPTSVFLVAVDRLAVEAGVEFRRHLLVEVSVNVDVTLAVLDFCPRPDHTPFSAHFVPSLGFLNTPPAGVSIR
jgi:hypothetical protein